MNRQVFAAALSSNIKMSRAPPHLSVGLGLMEGGGLSGIIFRKGGGFNDVGTATREERKELRQPAHCPWQTASRSALNLGDIVALNNTKLNITLLYLT